MPKTSRRVRDSLEQMHSWAYRQQGQEIARRVSYLELARTPRFMRNFAVAMYL